MLFTLLVGCKPYHKMLNPEVLISKDLVDLLAQLMPCELVTRSSALGQLELITLVSPIYTRGQSHRTILA
jgi:hypothetical protein